MDNKTYINESERTAIDVAYHGDLVALDYFLTTCKAIIFHGDKLDAIKKALFYGKEIKQNQFSDDCEKLPWMLSQDETELNGIQTLHAIIGMVTESIELLENMTNFLNSGYYFNEQFDLANIQEELGDHDWYKALLCRNLNFTFEDIHAKNIEKLKQRYPEKFTEKNALNRNLEVERQIFIDSEERN